MIYGQLAQTVQPNSKCNGCLHFHSNCGKTGLCVVGLQPFNCGDGSHPTMGYAPMTGGGNDYGPDNTPGATVGPHTLPEDGAISIEGGAQPDMVAQGGKTEVLGEEYVAMVKSAFKEQQQMERYNCPRHQGGDGYYGAGPATVKAQSCACAPIATVSVVKSFVSKLTNAERVNLQSADLASFIKNVLKSVPGSEEAQKAEWSPATQRQAQGRASRNPALTTASAQRQAKGRVTREPKAKKSEKPITSAERATAKQNAATANAAHPDAAPNQRARGDDKAVRAARGRERNSKKMARQLAAKRAARQAAPKQP